MAKEIVTEGWHLDKRVPVAIILGLVLQAGGFGWWAATLDQRVSVAERDIVRLEAQTDALTQLAQAQAVQLGRIEENIIAMRQDIARMVAIWERNTP